jgi:hypothetical protein
VAFRENFLFLCVFLRWGLAVSQRLVKLLGSHDRLAWWL